MGWQEPARSTAAGGADRRAHEPGHAYLAETGGDVPRLAETGGDVPLRLGLAPGGARLTSH